MSKIVEIDSCHDCRSYDGCENECMAAIGVVDYCPAIGIPSWCPLPDSKITNDAVLLLHEARSTLEMWKDVAPSVSLCADIDNFLGENP